jgi:hypothetical protein
MKLLTTPAQERRRALKERAYAKRVYGRWGKSKTIGKGRVLVGEGVHVLKSGGVVLKEGVGVMGVGVGVLGVGLARIQNSFKTLLRPPKRK